MIGARGTLTTLYRTSYIMAGCLLALCGSTMHPARLYHGGFRTIFFFCLVCGPLVKKVHVVIKLRTYYDNVHACLFPMLALYNSTACVSIVIVLTYCSVPGKQLLTHAINTLLFSS